MAKKTKRAAKRDRSLSKLIDFPSEHVRTSAERLAAKENRNLKNWIENLITKTVNERKS